MKKLTLFLTLACSLSLQAQTAKELKQTSLRNWGIGTAQYSGITPLDSSRYAVVSDKEPADGFFLFHITQDPSDGTVTDVRLEGFKGNARPRVNAEGICTRDCEGVAYFPSANTVFISGEGDQKILEYGLDGQPTGRELE
ncbi:MAG: esterase-like activity of phytase family protein, partial [Prevotellamassilia sp.]|nr:esterase-like activity of phytase family protein [Prevotellamassilia sp.]